MDENEKIALWVKYREERSQEVREQLIIAYAPLVKLVAGRLSMYLGFNVEYDDLVGYGIFGLIDAIDKYDTMKEVKFETYASLRIRGTILDQVRKMDWIPRTVRQRQKKIEQAIREIESRTGRVATDAEVAAQMEISEEEYNDWLNQLKVTGIISLDEFLESGSELPEDSLPASRFSRPEEAVEKGELSRKLQESLETLTERERSVILMYYYDDMTLKEIAAVLSVTESRISQIHTRAIQKMRGKLGEYMGFLTDK